jgi:hypothetical protein
MEPGATGAIAWLDLKPNPHATTLSCYPDGMFYYGQTGVFSPASCPDGWTTVSLKVDAISRDHGTNFANATIQGEHEGGQER